jgi:ABC-type bacteriocin/lantibiotic exporter with double-glycine peptidase domain
VLLGVGGWLVINRQLTLGQLVAAELVVELVVSGFSKMGKHLESYYDLLAGMDKLGYIEDLPLEQSRGLQARGQAAGPSSVLLRDVTVEYHGNPLLAGVWLDVRPGKRVGLFGHSGRGKSSLLDMLYGLRKPDGGAVEIDGIEVRDWDYAQLRHDVALVRAADIFEGTILENLRFGNESLPISEVRWALEQVGLLDEILALPEGLYTKVATGGRPLSEGQAMRVVVARVLLRRPRLLLVDEALDGLDDAPSRVKLLDAIFDVDKPWTLIVASGDNDILRRCDSVYSIESKQLVKS